MPSVDKKTGKPVGGAAKARRKKAQLEAERKRAQTAAPSATVQIAAPPASTADLVTWGAAGLAQVAYRAAQDRTLFLTELDQLRFLADTLTKIGLLRDKSAEQERLRRVAEATGKLPPDSAPAGGKPLAGISKPKTAR